jgi:hypothetical protein
MICICGCFKDKHNFEPGTLIGCSTNYSWKHCRGYIPDNLKYLEELYDQRKEVANGKK